MALVYAPHTAAPILGRMTNAMTVLLMDIPVPLLLDSPNEHHAIEQRAEEQPDLDQGTFTFAFAFPSFRSHEEN